MIDRTLVNKKDLMCGLVLIIFSVFTFLQLKDLPFRAAVFPQIMLTGIFVLAVLLTLRSLNIINKEKNRADRAEASSGNDKKEGESQPQNIAILATTLLTIVSYIFLMPILGFFLATILFMFAILFVLKMRRYLLMAFLAVLTSSVVFVVFKTVMYISLPGGIFDPTELLYMLID